MARWDYDPPEVGDTVNHTDFRTPFEAAVSAINDLEAEAVVRRTLHDAHTGTLVITDSDQINEQYNSGSAAQITQAYPGWDTVAGWARVDITTPATAVTTTTDAVATAYLEVDLGGGVDLSDARIAGIEVHADLWIRWILDDGGTPRMSRQYVCFFAIQVLDNAGTPTWHHIDRSERVVNSSVDGVPTQRKCNSSAEVVTLVRSEDLGANKTVTGVRVVVAVEDWDAQAGRPDGNVEARIKAGSLYTFALQAGGPN